ncbi:MAG: type VI secretion system baseplate subunit TssG [Desulfobulbaceae bacterium]|nr:type VI secretion system baseplate subunit TssG [Desulfobulbaceae bacterium]MCK5544674.1 type VI secretion system baseplate subunit TssG [Desulfobulbaceae bacterium]
MAGKDRESTAALKDHLFSEGKNYSFIQVIRLLRLLAAKEEDAGFDEEELLRRIRVRPELSLDFPGTDIVSIEQRQKDPDSFLITATFLGLYGVSSPLPAFYTEDLFDEWRDDKSTTRDFLDIVNSPLYSIFYKIWSKYQLAYKVVEENDQELTRKLFCLLGIENGRFRKQIKNPQGLLRYIGLFSQMPRSASGLRSLLVDRLCEPSIKVRQCIRRSVTIPADQRFLLGVSGCGLGVDSFLGIEVEDRMGKFRIELGPVDGDVLHSYLPDQERFDDMAAMVDAYLDQPLAWDLVIRIKNSDLQPARLQGPRWSRLGLNTWLFSGRPQPGQSNVAITGRA